MAGVVAPPKVPGVGGLEPPGQKYFAGLHGWMDEACLQASYDPWVIMVTQDRKKGATAAA